MIYGWKSELVVTINLTLKGITTYFSDNCTTQDSELINRFMKTQNKEAWMTRVFKTVNGVVPHYEVSCWSELLILFKTTRFCHKGIRSSLMSGKKRNTNV